MGDNKMEGGLVAKRRVKVSHQFICPITQEIMREPVIAEDGHTYEKDAIEEWLVKKQTSPMTRQAITAKLIPNLALKQLIDHWKEEQQRQQQQKQQQKGKAKAGSLTLAADEEEEEENEKWRLVDEEELHDVLALKRTGVDKPPMPNRQAAAEAKERALASQATVSGARRGGAMPEDNNNNNNEAEDSFGTSGWLAFAGAVAVVAGGVAWAASTSSSSSTGGEVKRKVQVDEDTNSCILS